MAPTPAEGWSRYRHQRALLHGQLLGMGWLSRLGLAVAFAGLIALCAQLSVPLPWTPVPFSFQVLGVLVTGAVLGRSWGFLSAVLYLGAGALGLEVFADQESSGLAILSGSTAGYLFAYPVAAACVGWYMERRRTLLQGKPAVVVAAGLGTIVLFATVATTWIALQGGRFESQWSATQSLLWLFVGMAGLGAVAAWMLVRRSRGLGWEKLNLFFVMLAAIAGIHACGVVVLKTVLGWSWSEAIALGSTVFLPFDLVKAGLATALTLLFLPTRDDEHHFLQGDA